MNDCTNNPYTNNKKRTKKHSISTLLNKKTPNYACLFKANKEKSHLMFYVSLVITPFYIKN